MSGDAIHSPVLVLVAHGTRSDAGAAVVRDLAQHVRAARPGLEVRLAYLDVQEPTLEQVLDSIGGRVAVVVPALLSRGYHVDVDVPTATSSRDNAIVTPHLGPDDLLVTAVADRLEQAEQRAGRAPEAPPATTVLAAVGSSRESARAEVAQAAAKLGAHLGRTVAVLTMNAPAAELLAGLATPVSVAAYLIAPGAFLDDLRAVNDDVVVAGPIGTHPNLVGLILRRYDDAVRGGSDVG